MNNIKIFISNSKTLSQEDIERIRLILPGRYKQAAEIKNEKERKLTLTASSMLIKHLNLTENDTISYNQFGKPEIQGKAHFNISHSEELCVLALSDYDVGVDIEYIKDFREPVAKKVFSENELEFVKGRKERFYAIWSMKESVLKEEGTGFAVSLKDFDVTSAFDSGYTFYDTKQLYLYQTYYKGYSLALCSPVKIDNVELIE